MGASVATIALSAVYFIGYEHPWWNPPNPGIVPSTKVVLKVLSLGFGAAPYFWWKPAVVLGVIFLGGLVPRGPASGGGVRSQSRVRAWRDHLLHALADRDRRGLVVEPDDDDHRAATATAGANVAHPNVNTTTVNPTTCSQAARRPPQPQRQRATRIVT